MSIFLVSISPGRPEARQPRNILILNSYHRGLKWTDDEVRGAKAVLLREIKDVEIYIEYMDTKRIRLEEYFELFCKMLQVKYDKMALDAIIATDDNALRFLLKYEEELFFDVPVVFCGVNDFEESMLDGRSNFTGLTEGMEFKSTIDLALKLHPEARRIVVISDHTTTGKGQRKDIMALEGEYEEMTFEYLNGEDLSTEELIEKLTGLGGESIAFLTTWIWDKKGGYVQASDSSISETFVNSSAPVYGFTDMWLNSGIVGGKLLNGRTHGEEAAKLVLRILDGEKPGDIAIGTVSDNPYMFNYIELKRREINVRDLPEGSLIFNEPKSLYYEHQTAVWIWLGVIAVQSGMVIILYGSILRRKRVEKALRTSEQRYSLAHRIAGIGAWESELETGKLHWSKECDIQFGYTPGQFKGTREAFYDECVYLDDRQYVLDSVNSCIEKGKEYNIEHRIIRADGSIRWVSTTADVIRDETGKPVRLVGISQDITDRKQAEETLAYSESIYRKAIENAHGVPYELRYSDGKYVFMGSGIEELFGLSAEEMRLKNTLNTLKDVTVISPPGYTSFEESYRAFREGKTDHVQLDGRITRGGQTKWISISNLPVKDSDTGEVTGSIGIIQDITERKVTEEKLKKARDDYLTISNLTGDIISKIDEEGRWTFLNDEACRFWGKPREKLLGENCFDYMHPEDVEKTNSYIKIVKDKKTVKGVINRQKTPGGWRTIEWNATGIFDEGGNYKGLQSTGRDITERKEAEKKVFEHKEQLKSLSSELLLAEERERRRIAIELHDRISQSLVISKIKLDSLREALACEEAGKSLKEVCNTLGQTIQDTRSLTFDLSSPILYELGFEMAVAEWLTEQIEKKNGISTRFRDDGKDKCLDNDISVLLFRTVRELLINVIKHSKAKHVTVSTRRVDNEIEVRVEDDGVGFNPSDVMSVPARIGRFGLFSIRERLEYLGGRIEIKSGASKGCKITVAAPLSIKKGKRAKK